MILLIRFKDHSEYKKCKKRFIIRKLPQLLINDLGTPSLPKPSAIRAMLFWLLN